jgi:hypothetical protein
MTVASLATRSKSTRSARAKAKSKARSRKLFPERPPRGGLTEAEQRVIRFQQTRSQLNIDGHKLAASLNKALADLEEFKARHGHACNGNGLSSQEQSDAPDLDGWNQKTCEIGYLIDPLIYNLGHAGQLIGDAFVG